MHEWHIPHRRLPKSTLTPEQIERFRDGDVEVEAISLIPWEEHCTECAAPDCYTTCDLYDPRPDGKCRRFSGGLGLIPGTPNVQGYVVAIEFKRWAQIMAHANAHLLPVRRARMLERGFLLADRVAANVPDFRVSIAGRRAMSSRLERRLKHNVTRKGIFATSRLAPDYFVVEILQPAERTVTLTLTIRNVAGGDDTPPVEELLEVTPGFHRFKIPVSKLARLLGDGHDLRIRITPNIPDDATSNLLLYFGDIGFVKAKQLVSSDSGSPKTVKIVAWDLDNTLWNGVLVEDGADGLQLQPGVASVIHELDRRGIVNTVVSKNHADEALEQLERFGLSEYFVFPQISWEPKSVGLQEAIRQFNVGADTVVFIDDQPFEREEVRSALPEVRVLNATDYPDLLHRTEFDPPVTAEASRRRDLYRSQGARNAAVDSFNGDYLDFVRSCGIRLTITSDGIERMDRVHELIQRTNQMNFSGSRYSRDEISALLVDPENDHFVLACEDRFGTYGMVGFALVRRDGPHLSDMTFSCRIQSKRVEHAFLSYLLTHYADRGERRFDATYVETPRNKPCGRVFADLGFEEASRNGHGTVFRYDLTGAIPSESIIEVVAC